MVLSLWHASLSLRMAVWYEAGSGNRHGRGDGVRPGLAERAGKVAGGAQCGGGHAGMGHLRGAQYPAGGAHCRFCAARPLSAQEDAGHGESLPAGDRGHRTGAGTGGTYRPPRADRWSHRHRLWLLHRQHGAHPRLRGHAQRQEHRQHHGHHLCAEPCLPPAR